MIQGAFKSLLHGRKGITQHTIETFIFYCERYTCSALRFAFIDVHECHAELWTHLSPLVQWPFYKFECRMYSTFNAESLVMWSHLWHIFDHLLGSIFDDFQSMLLQDLCYFYNQIFHGEINNFKFTTKQFSSAHDLKSDTSE